MLLHKKLKIFGLRAFVGGGYIDSIFVESSGALVWFFGNLVFAKIYNAVKNYIKSVSKKQNMEELVKSNEVEVKSNNEVEQLLPGMLVVATVFGK